MESDVEKGERSPVLRQGNGIRAEGGGFAMVQEIQKQLKQLEQVMDYWKAYVSLRDVLAIELSYSILYDNIRPDRLEQALATVGLDRLPDRFFLIQVDDYQNQARKLRLTQEYFQKTTLIHHLRTYLDQASLPGFVANLIGVDSIICYLCTPEQAGEQEEFLRETAGRLQELVRRRSAYTISICISPRCTRVVQFSDVYPRMRLALGQSYFTGKEVILTLDSREPEEQLPPAAGLGADYAAFLAAVSRGSEAQFQTVLQRIMEALVRSKVSPQRVRLEIIRLMQRVGEYCVRCGVPEDLMQTYNENAMNRILSDGFLSDTSLCLREYYAWVTRALETHSVREEYAFRMLTEAYIAEHYMEPIRLKDLSALLGFSEGYLVRRFRAQFGVTFVKYLTNYRIDQSKHLLAETYLPVDQIAAQVGITSYSYFCTCFKKTTGISPGAWRAQALRSNPQES